MKNREELRGKLEEIVSGLATHAQTLSQTGEKLIDIHNCMVAIGDCIHLDMELGEPSDQKQEPPCTIDAAFFKVALEEWAEENFTGQNLDRIRKKMRSTELPTVLAARLVNYTRSD